jgi:hypothetical protein
MLRLAKGAKNNPNNLKTQRAEVRGERGTGVARADAG